MWSGLPSWSGLIEELAEFLVIKGHDPSLVRREAERGELLQAASYGFDKLTRPQIGEFVRQVCRLGKVHPHEIHHKLVTLGPRCFVTSNYDRLIEASFQLWVSGRYYRVVTNRQLTETAEIVGARSTDFLFKLHGDVEDTESIILTREQYRVLTPGGERHHALETMQMLLASRPFIYVGFGLRDPDFMYVRDLLANTYKGGSRDHYAILADVTDAEKDYWRRNYGIHLITYTTRLCPDKQRDHKELLKLLDRLRDMAVPPIAMGSSSPIESNSASTVLILARHAARLSRVEIPPLVFPLHVSKEEKSHVRSTVPDHINDRYVGSPVEKLLDDGPENLVLTGSPGAGKSFAVRHSAARLAERLQERCLVESLDQTGVIVPIVVDLKLYKGDAWNLVEKALPAGLSLADLSTCFRVKIYFDAFNEMPRDYQESGEWEADFSRFLKRISNTSIIITSRTSDGLGKLNFPIFVIDNVNGQFVETQLKNFSFEIKGFFKKDILSILQKPFFFHLVLSGSLPLSKTSQPKDLFNAYLARLTSHFQTRFGIEFDITRPLALLAYNAIDQGREIFPVATAIRVLQNQIATAEIEGISATDIMNWLVGRDFLLPLSGGRVAFFHQSITEFLAATELARAYRDAPHLLRDRLTLRRWDQALFLTLSLLPNEHAATFLQAIIDMDFRLAFSAVRFMEFGRDEVVERLLREIPNRIEVDWEERLGIAFALGSLLPVSSCHEPLLRKLIKLGNMVGGEAASRLLDIRGEEVAAELLELLVEKCDDYNFCQPIGEGLSLLNWNPDISRLVALADRVQARLSAKEIDNYEGFDSALGNILNRSPLKTVYDAFYDCNKPLEEQKVKLSVLCDLLQKIESNEALKLSGTLILAGVVEATFSFHMIGVFRTKKFDLDLSWFGEEHVRSLVKSICDHEYDGWGIEVLRDVCRTCPEIADLVRGDCLNTRGILRTVLLSAAAADDQGPVFDELNALCGYSPEQLSTEQFELLTHLQLNWAGHESLFVRLLQLRNTQLAWHLLEPVVMGHDANLGVLEIGPIEWWLEWIKGTMGTDDGWWFQNRLSRLFTTNLNPEVRDKFVKEFNRPDSPYRSVLARTILLARNDLSSDQFTDDSISFLLSDLATRKDIDSVTGHLFESTATEVFVIEQLLPLYTSAEEPLRKNLAKVLRQIGRRHGRRYIAT